MTTRTGGCACGAVRYEATGGETAYGACHCETCRKWAGGPFLALQIDALTVTEGEDQAHVWTSSPWAERASCKRCGGNLWYRATKGPAMVNLALGTLDDLSGLTLGMEIFTDSKPDAYGFLSESSKKMTGAEVMAMYAPPA